MTGTPNVINLWCGPRNVSTALMYAWRQRGDTRVFDEPFYGLYLREFDPGHPARQEIIASMPGSQAEIMAAITGPDGPPVRFIKNMGHHLDVLDPAILDAFTNALLIREPARMIASLEATLAADATVAITGLAQQVHILDHELAAGRTPVVIDAQALLEDPAAVLAEMCRRLGLDFDPTMLSWSPGPKPEDGVWAPHWYANAHRSTGFMRSRPTPVELTATQRALLDDCLPLYERLRGHAIETDSPE